MKVFRSLFALFPPTARNYLNFFSPGTTPFCPWNSRAEFQQAIDSPKMKQLRQFLVDTIDLQAQFLIARLQEASAQNDGTGS